MEPARLIFQAYFFGRAFCFFHIGIIFCEQKMVVHSLFLSPADQHPVHGFRRPVLHRDPGQFQHGNLLDSLCGEFRDPADLLSFLLLWFTAVHAEDPLVQFLFFRFVLHKVPALPKDVVKPVRCIPVCDK